MKRPIRTVLVANRGEIAVRVMRTCRELGKRTVAVYSDADARMPHVLHADAAYRIGPAPSRESYLRGEILIDVARQAGADAIHPGYGFLSENAGFAAAVQDAGLIFIGPPAHAIRTMGDKTAAREMMQAAGVPVVPGTPGPIGTLVEAEAFCAAHGFPVLLKAAAGGGGKGMRVVQRMEDLGRALASAQSEALSAFGDGRVYAEKYLEGPRHIEIQVLADAYGRAVHLGERECSIQRRHQKVVEESPSMAIDTATRARMGETAVRAAQACGYVNAGTVEFLYDASGQFYFLEMNTRLQVEHPVTELRTGLDLVAEQLRIAEGESLPWTQDQITFRGHAIECRICAEDVERDFMPDTGLLRHVRPALGPGVRDDRGIDTGGEVSVYYDPMIAKLVTWASTREACIARMARALREYEIVGVKTNIPFCSYVLGHEAFTSGRYDTHFVRQHYTPERLERMDDDERTAAAAVACVLHARQVGRGDLALQENDGNGRLSWRSGRLTAMRS
jgi:acetyl-CoA carboxylase, biotin carboxylase subunit